MKTETSTTFGRLYDASAKFLKKSKGTVLGFGKKHIPHLIYASRWDYIDSELIGRELNYEKNYWNPQMIQDYKPQEGREVFE
jgi:hypothetical protein